MATRGAKPKPAALRVVDGTHNATRHGDRDQAVESVAAAADNFGRLERPRYITGEARKCWEQMIDPAFWLDASRFGVAVAFCELWKEFRKDPAHFPASKHGQMRAYMAELGLTDERNRLKKSDDGPKDPAENYF